MTVNRVILLGRLGSDPVLSYTPSGAAVCKFSVATSEKWTDKNGQKQESVEFSRVVVWGKLAELCNQYLAKGRQVFVEGKLSTKTWEKDSITHYMTEIVANSVQFLSEGKDKGSAPETSKNGQSERLERSPVVNSSFTSDDIPF